MTCTIEINAAENVNCYSTSTCSGFLVNPDNPERINKDEIRSYAPVDLIPDYVIEFRMKDGTVIVWVFPTSAQRDVVLANIDNLMGTVV